MLIAACHKQLTGRERLTYVIQFKIRIQCSTCWKQPQKRGKHGTYALYMYDVYYERDLHDCTLKAGPSSESTCMIVRRL